MKHVAHKALYDYSNQYAPLLGLPELREVQLHPQPCGTSPTPVCYSTSDAVHSCDPSGLGGLSISRWTEQPECPSCASGVAKPAGPHLAARIRRLARRLTQRWQERLGIVFCLLRLQAVADHSEAAHPDISVDPATEAVITLGATEALSSAMLALLNPGDEVRPAPTPGPSLLSAAGPSSRGESAFGDDVDSNGQGT